MARQTVSQSLAALCGILDCSADDDEAVGRVRTLLSHCNYNVASATEQYFATGWIQEATTPSNIEMARGDGKRQRTVAGDSADVDGRDGAGLPEMEEPIAQIFVDAGRASYSSETQAVLAAIHGLSEQFTLSVQLDSALPRALQASLPIALVEAEIFREKEKQAGLTTCTCARSRCSAAADRSKTGRHLLCFGREFLCNNRGHSDPWLRYSGSVRMCMWLSPPASPSL